MTPDFDILVIGGGMVGTCAAALLAQEPTLIDARIALLEAQPLTVPPADDVDLRVSAVSRASERILTQAQAWSHIPMQHRSAYSAMCVWDAKGKPDDASALHFSAAETNEPNLGYIIENRRIQWALLETEPMRKRVVQFAGKLENLEIESECVGVTLADERKVRVRFVLAADGAASPSRKLARIETTGWNYDQFAVVTHVATSRPHRQTAWQRFTATGPVAFLPLADGRSSIVWTTSPEQSEKLVAMAPEEFASELEFASDGVLGAITVTASRVRFPLQLAHAREYTRPRFALLGDAAHAVHPLAGQGVNLGFLDGAALVETFAAARAEGATLDELFEPRVLRRYERWRKSENALALGFIDGIQKLFGNESSVLGVARRAGFAAVEHTPPLKRFFIMRALGLAGERPKMVMSQA